MPSILLTVVASQIATRCPRCDLPPFPSRQDMLLHLHQQHFVSEHLEAPLRRRGSPGGDPAAGRFRCPEDGCGFEHGSPLQVEVHLRWGHGKMFCVYCARYFPTEDE